LSVPRRPLRNAGIVLGFGLGGFVDGIVAHQLLEWHHMLSARYPPTSDHHLRLNMIGDGLFHLACLFIVLLGVALLARARPPAPGDGRRLTGWMLTGWGLFNLIEGLVNHHLLGIHHVRPGPSQLLYDVGFLTFAAMLIVAGLQLTRDRGGRPS
jgi:uncharacterized membrane protein